MTVDNSVVTLFLENAAKSSAGTYLAEGAEEMLKKLCEIVSQDADIFCPQSTDLEKEAAALFSRLIPDYASVQVSVEEVSAAIAETGSIVCSSAHGKAVQASLLPSHHVAIVPRDKIVATLEDFFGGNAGCPPTNLTIITGPSRTADIELNLVIGVHGPERLDIIVV